MIARPFFSVIIPTIGRETLSDTLASIDRSMAEVVVVADTFDLDRFTAGGIRSIAHDHGARYFEVDAGCHSSGSPQLQYGYEHANGAWLLNVGDDDVYEPDAFRLMAAAIDEQDGPPHPLMFKSMLYPNDARGNVHPVTLWERPRIERFNVTGQGFACPNDPARLGYWYDDVAFMQATVYRHDDRIDWRDELTVRCY